MVHSLREWQGERGGVSPPVVGRPSDGLDTINPHKRLPDMKRTLLWTCGGFLAASLSLMVTPASAEPIAIAEVKRDAPVDFERRRYHHDDVFANLLYEGRLFDGQPVGHLHEHFGRAGFGRVYRSRRPVECLPFSDQLLGFFVIDLPRIGQAAGYLFVTVEPGEVRFIADEDKNLLAPLFASFGRGEYAHASGSLAVPEQEAPVPLLLVGRGKRGQGGRGRARQDGSLHRRGYRKGAVDFYDEGSRRVVSGDC